MSNEKMPYENTKAAIDGAIAYGRLGINPPTDAAHWLAEYWRIGQQLALVAAQKPVACRVPDEFADTLAGILAYKMGHRDGLAAGQEPFGWYFQHDETGRTTVVDQWQIDNGWERGNDRWQKIGPAYLGKPINA